MKIEAIYDPVIDDLTKNGVAVLVLGPLGGLHLPTVESQESKKVTAIAAGPMMNLADQLEHLRFLQDAGLVNHIVVVDQKKQVVLASEEFAEAFRDSAEQMGFVLRIAKEGEIDEVLDAEIAHLGVKTLKESAEKKEQRATLQPLPSGIRLLEKEDEQVAAILSSLMTRSETVATMLLKASQLESQLVTRMWQRFSQKIQEEMERSKKRAIEDHIAEDLLKAAILETLQAEEHSTVRFTTSAGDVIGEAHGIRGGKNSQVVIQATA